MADEMNMDMGDLGDLGEFSMDGDGFAPVIEDEQEILSQDLQGFASGFPDWDLLPPKR